MRRINPIATRARQRAALAVLILAVLLPATAMAARPTDLDGWRAARWGMDEAALTKAFEGKLIQLPARLVYGGAYADLALDDVVIGGQSFRALFQMSDKTDRLQQVLLQPERKPGQEATFNTTLAALRALYGEPDDSCAVPRSGGAPVSLELLWRFPTTTVHLVFFDFYTRSMAFNDPNRDPDPLTPYYKTRRNNPRFLPRRTLVRYHASGRKDLLSEDCR